MYRRIDSHMARTQMGKIIDLAEKNDDRFVVERYGKPAVVIMSLQDFIRIAAPPPDWLQTAVDSGNRRAPDSPPPDEIARAWRDDAK
jgi:hypothetical protein